MTTYHPHPNQRAINAKSKETRVANLTRRCEALEDENRRLREQVERLQALAADQDGTIRAMQDLRRRWK